MVCWSYNYPWDTIFKVAVVKLCGHNLLGRVQVSFTCILRCQNVFCCSLYFSLKAGINFSWMGFPGVGFFPAIEPKSLCSLCIFTVVLNIFRCQFTLSYCISAWKCIYELLGNDINFVFIIRIISGLAGRVQHQFQSLMVCWFSNMSMLSYGQFLFSNYNRLIVYVLVASKPMLG